jgi:hypothetical protein
MKLDLLSVESFRRFISIVQVRNNESFPLELSFLSEIEQVSNLLLGAAHVIEELGLVIRI